MKGHRARKRFGQNFLTDAALIQRIISAIHPAPGQLVLEIGPGQAALTVPLIESGARLKVVEIDRDLAATLERRFIGQPNFSLVCQDALQADFAEMTGGERFRLVGNLPYNISTPLLFHVLQWHDHIIDMHFMLQQEVVKRMAASPGSKAWGKLSVMCQYYCQVDHLFDVPPEAFTPAPRVMSSIVRLVPHERPPVSISDFDAFESLLSRSFSMRRKTLRNSLRGTLTPEQIVAAGVDPAARPETLGLEAFAALTEQFVRN